MTRPPVTVLMTVHNGEPYLRTAIDSVLAQTYPAFRLLIIDDASRDDTQDIIRSYDDPRIECVILERNVGQTAALNLGLRRAASPWLARMDADDYSAPERLETQMDLVAREASLGCIGTFAWAFRQNPQVVDGVIEKPLTDDDIRRHFWRVIPLIHGSLIMRRELMLSAGGYDERYRYAADWDLYHRLLARCRAANVPKPLLGIRRHPDQNSFLKASMDETIHIFSRALAVHGCARRERAALRAGLSYLYVNRARCDRVEGQLGELLRDVGCALRWSPATAGKQLFASIVPQGARAILTRPPKRPGLWGAQ
ncbi:MAG: hypothetical protein A3I71_04345 [Omnitrophica WOR_2 bacterium RIFCSPLOWO2_02_FULL_63_16]|nr:MAG: hypothetical protein A3I71_04345 [Omnitrophica WOR_2 bacterium RIFCSPLOWO2_02_FULL_63_16]OGX50209.1 MAG: hypothetical protein A3G88_05345 [Omnitrophica WOR_2 bacterium RIFCSPLOWO2_12_FULL_63_16]